MFQTTQDYDTIDRLEDAKAQLWSAFKRHLLMSKLWDEYSARAREDWNALQAVYAQLAALEGSR